jgi:hypothetical protein
MPRQNTLVGAISHQNRTIGDWWKPANLAPAVGSFLLAACAALAVLTVGVTPVAIAADFTPLQSFFDNTLICQDHDTKAVCHVWLNSDGSYYVFYDLGPQPKPALINGPFQFEGREGTYLLKAQAAGVEVCLRPSAPVVALAAQRAHEFLSEAQCYPLALHNVGARWQQADRRGREYTFWLMAGR